MRPVKLVHEVGGSSVSQLHMNFARTNQCIVIVFGLAAVLFLAVFAISVNHKYLHSSQHQTGRLLQTSSDINAGALDFYKKSDVIMRNHVENLNRLVSSLTIRNEYRLRKRMHRFAERFKHDLVSSFT